MKKTKAVKKKTTKKKIIKKAPKKKTATSEKKPNKKKSKIPSNRKNKIIKKKSKLLVSKTIKKTVKQDKTKKEKVLKTKKPKITFDDKLKEILEKLINKNKADGIYTLKIIEKAIPKKFRETENIKKLENLILSSNIKIYSEDEAKELLNSSKDGANKSEEAQDEIEKKQTGKTDDPVR